MGLDGGLASNGGQSASVDYGSSYVAAAPTGVLSTDTAAVLAAIIAAAGRKVVLQSGDYHVALSLADQDVHLVGPGRLIQEQGQTCITVARSVGAARAASSVSTVQLGVNAPATTVTPSETASRVDLTGDASDIKNGDLYFIASGDAYAADFYGNGSHTYTGAFLPVYGLGLDLTGAVNGGVAEGATVTGATSGASGYVQSAATQQDGSTMLTFSSVTGAFQNGETLQVSGQNRGTASGVLFVIMAGRLLDTFTTTPSIYKVTTGNKCILDVAIAASGDVESSVGSANRKPAIILQGVSDADVKVTVESAWTRAVQLLGCYGCEVDAKVRHLPSHDLDSAYGYGVEAFGSTENCRIKVIGRNLRHAFTTNPSANSAFANVTIPVVGIPKYNVIHDSVAYNSEAAGFDTHGGAYFTTFDNCHVFQLNGGWKNLNTTAAFQNRAWGTLYRNCTARGCIRGFYDISGNFGAPPIKHTIRYEGCTVTDYQWAGFYVGASNSFTDVRLEYISCEAQGDGSTSGQPYSQAGFYFANAANAYCFNCRSRRFNSAPFWIGASSARYAFVDCFADYSESGSGLASSVNGFRLDAAPTEIALIGYKIRLNPSVPNTLTGALRIAGGAVTLYTDGVKFINGAPQTFANVTGGSLTLTGIASTAGVPITRTTTATSYTATAKDGLVAVTSTAAARTVTLPAANSVPPGWPILINDESGGAGTNNITVSRAGTDTIEGGTSKTISTNYGSLRLYSDGSSAWFVGP